jgi:hypothetical protein
LPHKAAEFGDVEDVAGENAFIPVEYANFIRIFR